MRGHDDVLADPPVAARKVLHRHDNVPGVGSEVTVQVCAFDFAHGGPSIESPPPPPLPNVPTALEQGFDGSQLHQVIRRA